MLMKDIIDMLDARVIYIADENIYEKNYDKGFATDLMSDALALLKNETEDVLFLTGLSNVQSLRTAEVLDLDTVLFVCGKPALRKFNKFSRRSDMKEIIYKFQDGTKQTVKVQDDFYKNYEFMEKESKKQERKETRRHIPLSFFDEQGVEFEDIGTNIEESLIKDDIYSFLGQAVKLLNQKQQHLIYQVFYDNKSLTEIAKEQGISKSAITQQMQVILKKLREILKNFGVKP